MSIFTLLVYHPAFGCQVQAERVHAAGVGPLHLLQQFPRRFCSLQEEVLLLQSVNHRDIRIDFYGLAVQVSWFIVPLSDGLQSRVNE